MKAIPVSLKRTLIEQHQKYLAYYEDTEFNGDKDEDGCAVDVHHFQFPSDELTQEFLNDVGGLPDGKHQALLWTTLTAKEYLDLLITEAQERFPIGSEVPREEIIAWLDSRHTHHRLE